MLSLLCNAFIQAFAKHMFETLIIATCVRADPLFKYLTFTQRKRNRVLEKQLEAHPIYSNQQLLLLDVRSKGILWSNFITPLQARGSARHFGSSFISIDDDGIPVEQSNRREVLVCHDMMGNYREDRHYNSSRKWDEYRFYHWAGIDYFCYFSHNYVTIPPGGWINAAHLHGVRVLGTFITEGREGRRLLREVLQTNNMADQIADALVRVCQYFCFEGWLINIECEVDPEDVPKLIYFMDTLRKQINDNVPNGIVLWYDSVITTGKVAWQNEINEKNVKFFKASDRMLINYCWKDESLTKTAQTVQLESRKLTDVFFGIDVFARGQIAKFQSHETLGRIARYNFSAGIFAPGWTFETLRNYDYNIDDPQGNDQLNDAFLRRNEKFWNLLWPYCVTRTYSQLPFYTDFCLGSGKYTFEFGKETPTKFFNLSRQSLQPSVPLFDYAERCYECGVNGGSSLEIIKYNQTFRLFTTEFRLEKSLIFAFACKIENSNDQIDCWLKLSGENTGKTVYVVCGDYHGNIVQEGRIFATPINEIDFSIITRMLHQKQDPLKLPFQLTNGWTVRYFGLNFNRAMCVKDIGVQFKKSNPTDGYRGYLGAMYLHSVDLPVSSWLSIYLV